MSKFKVGDRVRIKETSTYHTHSTEGSNPGLIEGTIDEIGGGCVLHIGVLWDNGRHNSYGDDDLNLVKGSKIPTKVEVDEAFIREAYAAAGLSTMQMKLEKKFPDLFSKKYRIGQRFSYKDGDVYILSNASAQSLNPRVTLINTTNGNCWSYSVKVEYVTNITAEDFSKICNGKESEFTLISK